MIAKKRKRTRSRIRIIALVIVALLALLHRTNMRFYRAAHESLRAGDTEKAVALMRRVVVQEPFFYTSPGRDGRADLVRGIRESAHVWKTRHKWTVRTGDDVKSFAAYASGSVYIGSNDRNLYKIDAESGKVVWKFYTDGEIETQPLIVGGTVYVASHPGMFAVDADTGKKLWFHKMAWAESSPAYYPDGGLVIAGSNDRRVFAFNAKTGKTAWMFKTSSPVESWPTIDGSRVFVGSNGGDVYAIDAGTGKQIWRFAGDGTIEGKILFNGGRVYAGSKRRHIYCLNAADGRLVWKKDMRGRIEESVGESENMVLFGDHKGDIVALDPATGKTRWKFSGAGWIEAPITVYRGVVYAGCHYGFLYAIDARNGKLIWRFLTGWDIDESGPFAFDNTVVIGSLDDSIYAFKIR